MTYTVSPMTQADLPALAALERICFSEPWSADALREELDNPLALFLTARTAAGEPAGYVGLHLIPPEAFMANLAVFPAHRRRGVARLLLRQAIARCAAACVTRLALEVRAGNTAAIALYTACGFVQDGRRPGFYSRPTEDALLLSLPVKKGLFGGPEM
ncbi:MAG: ribosomal protein S18-alanine N-acetyltransferase [Clostridia bacterium]|nr:ribosomal protein S18-alanine N-acetyltransferase [Clostridia bacterium]